MKSRDWVSRIPWTIVACAVFLTLVGLTGIERGDQFAGRGDYLARQLVWVVLAVVAAILAVWFPYRLLRHWSYPLFLLSLVLLGLVYFLPARHGAHRWIPIGPLNLQPSELAKLAYVLALAHYLMYRNNYRRFVGLVIPFLLTAVPVLLILREPDLGTALLFWPVLFAMLFAAGARPRHLALICLLGTLSFPLLWMAMSSEQKSRVVTLFLQTDGGPTPKGDGYHLHQSKRVLALGGLAGSQALDVPSAAPVAYYLPAARTDFVFCLVGERWGFVGCLAVLGAYALLFARGLLIAAATREPFGRLVAVGVVTLIAAQATINMGMTVGLMPITGMTLPLMSYGGSSLVTTCLALGLLINVGVRPGYEITAEPFRFTAKEAAY